MKSLIVLMIVLPLAACSWGIKLDSAGSRMRVAWNDDVGACRDLGRITVSVLDKVGPVNRRNTKVNDELEIMARNEGAGMGADTIKPLGDARDGEQSWGAYVCGDTARGAKRNEGVRAGDGAQTFPIRDH